MALHRPSQRTGAEIAGEPAIEQEVDGRLVDLDRPVAIGQAPAAERGLHLLVDDPAHDRPRERPEDDDAVEAVDQLGAEDVAHGPLHPLARERARTALAEAERLTRLDRRAEIGRDDDDGLAEVDGLAGAVRQAPRIEDLQEQIPELRCGLLELVKQHDRERLRPDARCERLSSARVAGADDALDAVRVFQLAHVDPDHPLG